MHIEMLTGRTTIDDFYGKAGYLESVQHAPDQRGMRLLIDALRRDETPWHAFCMTHMHVLGLRAVDVASASEFVSIMAASEHHYCVKYLMPEAQAPWPYAWVGGRGVFGR